jgi:hypothetical protein
MQGRTLTLTLVSPKRGHHMRISIGASDRDHVGDVDDLHAWLSESREVSSTAKLALESDPASGAMSAGDVIVLTCTAASSVSALLQAYVAWRTARQDEPRFIVQINGGSRIILSSGSATETGQIGQAAKAASTEPEG